MEENTLLEASLSNHFYFRGSDGTARPRKLIDLILAKVPLELVTGEKVIVDVDGKDTQDSVARLQRFISHPNEEPPKPTSLKFNLEDSSRYVTLPKFLKSVEFKGKGGSDSDKAEEYIAFACSVKAGCSCKLKHPVEDVKNYLEDMDMDWIETCNKSVDIILSKIQTAKEGSFIYQAGNVYETIRSQFIKLNTIDDKKYFGGFDKWNPADIWYCVDESNVESDTLSQTSLQSLTDFMDDQLNKQRLVGISLKKVGSKGSEAFVVGPKPGLKDLEIDFPTDEVSNRTVRVNIPFKYPSQHYTDSLRRGKIVFDFREGGSFIRNSKGDISIPVFETHIYMADHEYKSGQIASAEKLKDLLGLGDNVVERCYKAAWEEEEKLTRIDKANHDPNFGTEEDSLSVHDIEGSPSLKSEKEHLDTIRRNAVKMIVDAFRSSIEDIKADEELKAEMQKWAKVILYAKSQHMNKDTGIRSCKYLLVSNSA